MRYLITGGAGFIGTNLIKKIQDKNSISIVDKLLYGFQDNIDEDIKVFEGGVEDFSIMREATKGIDVVIHLAANTGVLSSIQHPEVDFYSNAMGTFVTLKSALENGVSRVIFASSGAVLGGDIEPPIHEELKCSPMSPYAASKLTGEAYCSSFYHSYGISTVSLRFSNVYGPYSNNKNSLIHKFIKHVLNSDDPFYIYGDGKQTRDFIYVDDLVTAIIAAANLKNSKVSGNIFQIATQRETSVLHVLNILKNKLENILKKEIIILNSEEMVGEVKRNFADISKAKDILGYSPKIILDKGLNKTIKWFLGEYKWVYQKKYGNGLAV